MQLSLFIQLSEFFVETEMKNMFLVEIDCVSLKYSNKSIFSENTDDSVWKLDKKLFLLRIFVLQKTQKNPLNSCQQRFLEKKPQSIQNSVRENPPPNRTMSLLPIRKFMIDYCRYIH